MPDQAIDGEPPRAGATIPDPPAACHASETENSRHVRLLAHAGGVGTGEERGRDTRIGLS
jgi:hypothetical protein